MYKYYKFIIRKFSTVVNGKIYSIAGFGNNIANTTNYGIDATFGGVDVYDFRWIIMENTLSDVDKWNY